jgi:hypothetical protein
MASYKAPSFNERTALAAQARQKALDALKAKPAIDPAVLAERAAAAAAKEAAKIAAAAEKKAAMLAEKARIAEEKAALALANAPKPPKTEEQKKAERDARYAARKANR